jgi:RimJ/RimL family protein N-acetyltransferase
MLYKKDVIIVIFSPVRGVKGKIHTFHTLHQSQETSMVHQVYMYIPQVETQRLILRGFREEDLDAYTQMCSDPEVMRYIGERKPLSRWESWRSMAVMLGHWQLRG